VIDATEVEAGFIVLALDLLASVEVEIILVAIAGLVLVGEPRVKRCGLGLDTRIRIPVTVITEPTMVEGLRPRHFASVWKCLIIYFN